MSTQHQNRLNWRATLSAIAISVSVFGIESSPLEAAPKPTEAGLKLAQVGVHSRVQAPTPLNLRPRTHIPLPTSSRSRDYHGYSRYGGYRRGGYRHGDHYHCNDHHHDHHRGKHRNRGPVIIINPGTSSSYSNYSHQGGYIRVIRK